MRAYGYVLMAPCSRNLVAHGLEFSLVKPYQNGDVWWVEEDLATHLGTEKWTKPIVVILLWMVKCVREHIGRSSRPYGTVCP